MKIKTKLLIVVALITIYTTAAAQQPTWLNTISSTGGGSSSITKIIHDSNNNMIISGDYIAPFTLGNTTVTTNANNGPAFPWSQPTDLFIAKYDASGNLLWLVYPIGIDSNDRSMVLDMITDQSGNIIVYMNFSPKNPNSAVVFGNDTIREAFSLVKFDQNGNVVWHKDNGGFQFGGHYLAQDNSGNIFLTASLAFNVPTTFDTITVTSPNPTGTNEVAIVKFNSSGAALWVKTIGGNNQDIARDIHMLDNNDFYVCGEFTSDTMFFNATNYVVNTIPSSNFPSDYFYAKFDNNGNLIWGKSIPYASAGLQDGPNWISGLNNNDELVISGHQESSNFQIGSFTLNSPGMFTTNLDNNGNPIWATVVSDSSLFSVRDIQFDGYGNSYTIGDFYSDSIMIGNKKLYNTAPNTFTSDIFGAILDANGVIIGSFKEGSDGNDVSNSINVKANSSLHMSGTYNGNSITLGSTVLNNPNYPKNQMYIANSSPIISGLNNISLNENISIYPNPATTEINLQIKNITNSSAQITIMNMLGETVYSKSLSQMLNSSIDISNFMSGLYIVNIQDNKNISSSKFIKF